MKIFTVLALILCSLPAFAFDYSQFYDCAPNVAPETIDLIIQVESGGHPFALNVNGYDSFYPDSADESYELANYFISKGYSVDIGLMQINSKNLSWLGYTVSDCYDPCLNISMGGIILSDNYQRALGVYRNPQRALVAALSAYNTGSFNAGIYSGYVSKYYK